ncbi:MAG: sulfatase-like hydrolase/transferase, partial [Armatimonadetes bacterium]|nr:sulfatase-like hydrolase/transferase [Armatimonadota bacterium]
REYASWRAEQGLPPRPRTNGYFGETDAAIDAAQSRLAWGADRMMALLTRYAGMDTPFFLRWDPSEPHLPNVVPEPYASFYPPEDIPPWPGFPDPLCGKPYAQAQQRRTWGVDGWTWRDWAPVVGRYLGEITLLDAQIGRLLAHLQALGLTESTVVVYTADHGDMCGSHGMVDKHLVMYDDVVRVPLLVRWPGQAITGVCDAFVSSALDLAATFCDIAGVPGPDTFVGQSLVPLLRGAGGEGRDCGFSMYHGGQFGLYSQRMVRDARWKYIWNTTAEDELYDLAQDPGEIVNLAASPDCRDNLRRLRRRLVDWMECRRDPLCNEWTKPQLLQDRTL